MLTKFFIFLIGTALGVAITYYNRWLVRNFGTVGWAERIFGGAGTYFMWQLAGVLVVILTLMYVFNGFEGLASWIGRSFGG